MLDIDVRSDIDNIHKALYLNNVEFNIEILFDDLVDYCKIDEETAHDTEFDMKDQENDELDDQSKMEFLEDYVDDFIQEVQEGAY